MSLEERPETRSESLGSLGVCLVDGDPEQRMRERKIRRRALVISIFLQSAILAALILIPLFGKGERLAMANMMPQPIYTHIGDRSPQTPQQPQPDRIRRICVRCIDLRHPIPPITDDFSHVGHTNPGPPGAVDSPFGDPSCSSGCIDMANANNTNTHVDPPPQQKKRITRGGDVEAAMLTHRVAPQYPALPRQMHRSGQVRLRAIIATDGTIQSLEVFDGDPLFYESAKSAVLQWRYKPTYLNGQPVEVETVITVVYTLQQ